MSSTDRVIVASGDTHVSPPLSALRPYVESRLLDDFDSYVKGYFESLDKPATDGTRFDFGLHAQSEEAEESIDADDAESSDQGLATLMAEFGLPEDALRMIEFGNLTQGTTYSDVKTRLDHLNFEKTAVEVIFHGTAEVEPENGRSASWPLPWSLSERSVISGSDSSVDRELVNAGRRVYNRWLADLCSVEPERHVGLAHVPVWDMDAAVAELHWAKENGLRSVNFPAPGSPFPAFDGPDDFALSKDMPPYEDEYWDPFFATCQDLDMPLTTHVGHPILPPYFSGPASFAVVVFEQMPLSGRNLWHLIFGGVFDRFPRLKYVITEVLGPWAFYTIDNMDSIYESKQVGPGMLLRQAINKAPSEYIRENVYFGCSFMSRPEALAAVERELTDRFMWGSDWPHPEGTWHPDTTKNPVSPLSMANSFHGLAEDQIRAMAGLNLIDCYGLDEKALTPVAERIGPTLEELTTEPDLSRVPDSYVGQGFRDAGLMFT